MGLVSAVRDLASKISSFGGEEEELSEEIKILRNEMAKLGSRRGQTLSQSDAEKHSKKILEVSKHFLKETKDLKRLFKIAQRREKQTVEFLEEMKSEVKSQESLNSERLEKRIQAINTEEQAIKKLEVEKEDLMNDGEKFGDALQKIQQLVQNDNTRKAEQNLREAGSILDSLSTDSVEKAGTLIDEEKRETLRKTAGVTAGIGAGAIGVEGGKDDIDTQTDSGTQSTGTPTGTETPSESGSNSGQTLVLSDNVDQEYLKENDGVLNRAEAAVRAGKDKQPQNVLLKQIRLEQLSLGEVSRPKADIERQQAKYKFTVKLTTKNKLRKIGSKNEEMLVEAIAPILQIIYLTVESSLGRREDLILPTVITQTEVIIQGSEGGEAAFNAPTRQKIEAISNVSSRTEMKQLLMEGIYFRSEAENPYVT